MNTENIPASRWQQVIPAAMVVALAGWVSYVSFAVEDPEPYLFPRLVAVALLLLSLLAFARAMAGRNRTGGGLRAGIVKNVAPGIAVMCVFVFFAAEFLGFYAASALTFFAIVTLYDPSSHRHPRTWAMRFVVMLGFMAVMYGLFSLLLKVQTPRGLFF